LLDEESEKVQELNKTITDSLIHIFKNTKDAKVVGDVSLLEPKDLSKSPTKSAKNESPTREDQEETKEKVNHYEKMNLAGDKTNLLTWIGKEVGYVLNPGKNVTSPKANSKAKSGSATKTGGKKKAAKALADSLDMGLDKQVILKEALAEPCFRYVCDRKTMQRMIYRVADYKDDIDV
jgi:hypothetical protein